ncbi:hypothetical protein [Rubrobacter indicoceani]|uniref:hypothetical protein n=1 Tax=Rubrobacter indicoceani TaxID=2051957 RepID=UPI0013C4CEE7|nr:hypothetical protein [Rubrobacter indicoceani]
MTIVRYQTVGAVAPDLDSVAGISERVEEAGGDPGSIVVFSRRRDAKTVGVALPEAEVRSLDAGLTRAQRVELGSAYLGVTSVSVLMGAVHLPTGIVVQAVMTLAVVVGLILHYRRPKVRKKISALGLPKDLAERWDSAFDAEGFALVLVVVPERDFDEVQDAFLEDEALREPLAVDRRPVL